ncbi:MAG: YkgJ family cysteine cluster protein [Dehalococcoidia bacterium]|nr:YkgJ family cysteine cluster protein [Dehalococcoidia bacterium]
MDFSGAATDSPRERWFEGGLRFQCTSCGKCCTGSSGSVQVSTADLERLANFFELPAGTFARRYTRVTKGRRALIDGPGSHDCVFLTGKTCSVYEARPTQCRTYPWWIRNIRDPESWQEAGEVCEGINHPEAPVIPASEILEQCRTDLENEAS